MPAQQRGGGTVPTPVLAFDRLTHCWPAFQYVTYLSLNLLSTQQTEVQPINLIFSEVKLKR